MPNMRCTTRNLLMLMVAFFGNLLAAGNLFAAQTPSDYATLPGKKALATVHGQASAIYGIAHSQPTDIAAARQALQQCRQKLAGLDNHIEEKCEIANLNQETITSGADIRALASSNPHALYLWRYRSDAATVYLAGSIHILKATLYPLAPQLEQAFEQSHFLALEVDTKKYPLDEMQRKMMDVALLDEGTLKNVLPEALLVRVHKSLANYGINAQMVSQFKPAMVMNQLVVLRLQALGYLPEYGLEQHFRAKLGNRQILELESIDTQLDVLFNQPLEIQVQLLADTLELEPEIEPLLAEMLVAWLTGNDADLSKLIEQQSGDSELSAIFNRRLLNDRNVGMTKTISQYLETSGTYFVLVGAAHLIGESGIINLLEAQGIQGQRIRSDDQL